MLKIIILDDHQLFIHGLLNSFIDDELITISGYETDPEKGIALIRSENPDLVILDVVFTCSGIGGIDILREIKKGHNSVKVLILTGCADRSLIRLLRMEGADGYRIKNIGITDLRQTIIDICLGIKVFLFEPDFVTDENIWDAPVLSEKAVEIIKLLSRGMSVKEIALARSVAETTVIDHIERSKRKLNAKNNAELVALAHKSRLI